MKVINRVSIVTSSFQVYSFAFGTNSGTIKHKQKLVFMSSGGIICILQRVIK